jgi:hypothetical protein
MGAAIMQGDRFELADRTGNHISMSPRLHQRSRRMSNVAGRGVVLKTRRKYPFRYLIFHHFFCSLSVNVIAARGGQVCSVICLLIGLTTASLAQEPMYGLTYCAPPSVPKCIDMKKTFHDPSTVALCELEVARYVPTAVAYRDCLLLESQRAIFQANNAIERFKCAANAACCNHPDLCPTPH